MKRKIKGSLTIEAAVIVPLILGIFMIITIILFYYHDKNVISAVAHETVVKTSYEKEMTAEDTEIYFQRRIKGKLLLFPGVDTNVEIRDTEVYFQGITKRHRMTLQVEMKMKRTEPEKMIRNIRRIGAIK